jgi:hypothetical protein
VKRKIAAVGIVLVAIASTTWAGDWRQFGPRTLGMGGAGAASSRGAWSLMCNPAGLAEPEVGAASRISFSGAGTIRDIGLFDSIDALSDYDWDVITSDPTNFPGEIADIAAQLRAMNDGKGLMLGVGSSAVGAYGGFGAGLTFDVRAAFIPHVDLVNTNPTIDGASGSFATNQSAVSVKAIMLTELPVGYARKLELGNGAISLGGALKIMRAITYDERVEPTLANSDDFQDSITDSEKTSMNVGLDLGAIYHPPVDGLSIGLVARNINSPKFDTANGDVSEDIQVRLGGEWAFWDRLLCVALDADLNERDTILDGYKERWIGGGVSIEGTPSIFALAARLGIMRNVAESDPGVIFTGGFSVGLKWFHLSVSGAMSSEDSKIDDSTFPAEFTGMLAFEATW